MITKLTIENFKCFESQTFRLSNFTLLAGLNGTGKSSVLQALLLLRQSYEQKLLPGVGIALNGEYAQIGTARDALYENAAADNLGFTLAFLNGTAAQFRYVYNADEDVLTNSISITPQGVFGESLFADSFAYLQAERLGPRTFFPMSDYDVRHRNRIGIRGEYAAHFLERYGRVLKVESTLCHPSTKSVDLQDQMEAWLGEISPGTRIHTKSYAAMDAVNLEFSFRFGRETTKQYRSTNVGFGISYSFPVILAILAARPGSLLLIENPEAHVHPQGQVTIGMLLALAAQAGIQVIVETHSDHLLNGLRIALHRGRAEPKNLSLHFFRRDVEKSSSASNIIELGIDHNGRLTSRPPGFFDEFSKSLDELLKPSVPYGSENLS